MVRAVTKAFATTFCKWRYVVLALTMAMILLFVAIWLPNISFLRYILTSPAFSWSARAGILWASWGNLETNFTPATRILALAIVLLAAINVSLMVFHLRQRVVIAKEAGASLAGTLLGLVSVGCASCGSVILASIFGVSATVGFLGSLPLRGLEFGILSIGLLLVSIVSVAKRIASPLSCNVG